jgi:hypothetical protein
VYVRVLLGKGNLNTEGEGRVKVWGGIEGRLCGVVTQGEKGGNRRLVEWELGGTWCRPREEGHEVAGKGGFD